MERPSTLTIALLLFVYLFVAMIRPRASGKTLPFLNTHFLGNKRPRASEVIAVTAGCVSLRSGVMA